MVNTHVQIDKIIYFAMLLKKCVDVRVPKSDSSATRSFLDVSHSFIEKNQLREGYSQNERSSAYLLTMSKELEIIYRNNKPTPWGTGLAFFVPEEIPMELSTEFKILFARSFLLEDFAFLKSLTEHMDKFGVITDDYSWYSETKDALKSPYSNTALSVYIHALKIAYESSESVTNQRRFLSLYRQTAKKGKNAKALFHKIKPPLGIIEDIGFIQKRKSSNNAILFAENNGHKPCIELMKLFPDYKLLTRTYNRDENLISTILVAFGYKGTKTLRESEILSLAEALYPNLADPIFNVCDLGTLISILVVQKSLDGYSISEPEVKKVIEKASKKNRYKYQILPDRRGVYRFFKFQK
jgi:hypothetical protein